MTHIHPFEPIWTPQSTVLILGTFPSAASRMQGFYYGHPRNRFWPLLAGLYSEQTPDSTDKKIAFLTYHGIALWDVLASCDITGSDDASIRQPVPNDIASLVSRSNVQKICCNGNKAYTLYRKYCDTATPVICLPSTSPANAAWELPRLMETWKQGLCSEAYHSKNGFTHPGL